MMTMNPNEHRDHCTRAGAERLARDIVCYWAERGYLIGTTIKSVGRFVSNKSVFAIRSDMVGGMPVRKSQ